MTEWSQYGCCWKKRGRDDGIEGDETMIKDDNVEHWLKMLVGEVSLVKRRGEGEGRGCSGIYGESSLLSTC
jgi:hypothetical protein